MNMAMFWLSFSEGANVSDSWFMYFILSQRQIGYVSVKIPIACRYGIVKGQVCMYKYV